MDYRDDLPHIPLYLTDNNAIPERPSNWDNEGGSVLISWDT
jgi:hypothetical protein